MRVVECKVSSWRAINRLLHVFRRELFQLSDTSNPVIGTLLSD